MDVLLLNPNSRKNDYVEEPPLLTPPINLLYAAQSMENNGYNPKILDSFALNLSAEEIMKYIKAKDPEVIGIPLYSCDLTEMFNLTRQIKEDNPGRKIFFAGHHATALNTEVMNQFPEVDYLVRGEGEVSSVKLLEAIEKDSDLSGLKGISYRLGKRAIHNPEEKPIENIDDIPIPSRKFIDPKLYHSRLTKKNKIDVLITSRGCPFKCTFCAKLNESFRGYRPRSAENIIEEMSQIKENGIDCIDIYDEIFTYDRERVNELLSRMKKEKLDFEFRIRTRVTHVDKVLLANLKKRGCSTISYGVESGNQRVLNEIHKGTTIDAIKKAFSETDKAGLNTLGFFMIGNRTDTPESIRQTMGFAKKLNPLFATFGVLHPYPGTIDYNEAKANGTLQGEYAPFKPAPWIKLPWMKDITELYKFSEKAYDEYYKRPAYIAKFMKSVISQGNWNLFDYTIKNFYKKISRINAI